MLFNVLATSILCPMAGNAWEPESPAHKRGRFSTLLTLLNESCRHLRSSNFIREVDGGLGDRCNLRCRNSCNDKYKT